jgi:predicted MPP superfamily phosphohydrolase
MTRRQFLLAAAATPIAAALYTWRVEPHWLEVVRREMLVEKLPANLEGARLAQLSDIHIGAKVDDDYVRAAFHTVAKLEPDFVVLTGDLVSYEGASTLVQAESLLRDFPRGTRGTFAVLGNHDYGAGWSDGAVADQIANLLTQTGVTVLRNGTAMVDGLKFVGFDDLWAGRALPAVALMAHRPDEPAIALCHNPDGCDILGWEGFRGWILAGHTHGGQCKPPFLPAPLLPVRNRRYTAGEFELSGGRRLYISRGVGHLLRVRFNVRPEVTLFTLRRA